MINLTKTGFDEKEYSALVGEIDLLSERMRGVKGKWGKESQDYLMEQETEISKFDEKIFLRFVEKVRVRSMVEVEFVFKTGMEVREILK